MNPLVSDVVDLAADDVALADRMNAGKQQVINELRKVIVGQQEVIDQVLLTLFVGGNSLIVGAPGLAKTLLIHTMARVLDLKFSRIQFTPDLMPSDITGTDLVQEDTNTGKRAMVFAPGPIFANIVLADEINRAPQKTQSALLEAMQERQVTIGEHTFPLDDPFWVLATQNPVEQEGVFALPEAQLDRFAMMLRVQYPSAEHEVRMLQSKLEKMKITPVADPQAVVQIRKLASEVHVDEKIHQYIVALGQATRTTHGDALPMVKEMLQYGISPRSYHHLLAMSRATAFMRGRDFVAPADVKFIAPDVMHHRMVRTIRAEVEGVTTDEVVAEVLRRTSIP